MNKSLCSVSFLLLLTLVLPAAASEPARSSSDADTSQASASPYTHLMAQATTAGYIRVIVGLDIPFQTESDLPSLQAVEQQQATIAQTQDALLNRLAALEVSSVKAFPSIPYVALTVDADGLAVLMADPSVQSIEEDRVLQPMLEDSVPLIGANLAWDSGYSGEGWSVAVLDSGFDSTHPFLDDKIVAEACYSDTNRRFGTVTLCPNGRDEQVGPGASVNCDESEIAWCGHGTHVAGIVAGRGNDMSGVARDANLITIQVFSRSTCVSASGEAEPCIINLVSDLVRGLSHVYELRNEYNIAAVNLSLGGMNADGDLYLDAASCDQEETAIKSMVDTLHAAGIATIAASGNDFSTDGMQTPACLSNAVSVGATNDSDNIEAFSNIPPFLDLLAPGKNIVSSVPGGNFGQSSGTSQATPHVAGAWAVLKSCAPDATPHEILTVLRDTGVLVTDSGTDGAVPRIHLDGALETLGCPVEKRRIPSRPANFDANVVAHDTIELTWQDISTNEQGFIIERSKDLISWTQIAATRKDVTSYSDTNLKCESTYFYRIYAFNYVGASDYGNLANAITSTCPPPTLPSAPVNLFARASGQTSIVLNWEDMSSDEAGFVLERSLDGLVWNEVSRLESDTTEYTDTGIQCGTNYFYQVYAFNAQGNSAYSNRNSATTMACTTAVPGDCNVDGSIDAGDLSALVLTLSQQLFDQASCDADSDGTVSMADIACTVQLAFGKPCAAPGGPTSVGQTPPSGSSAPAALPNVSRPSITIPTRRPAQSGSMVQVPVAFSAGGEAISSLVFSIDYDQTLLSVQSIDTRGLPDAFQSPTIDHDVANGRINIALVDRADPLSIIPDGTLITVTFGVSNVVGNTLANVSFSNNLAASFGTSTGQSINGTTFDGSVQIIPDVIAWQHVYLPLIRTSSAPMHAPQHESETFR